MTGIEHLFGPVVFRYMERAVFPFVYREAWLLAIEVARRN